MKTAVWIGALAATLVGQAAAAQPGPTVMSGRL